MADVMGAAAGFGMICLILMLIGAFLAEIRVIRKETLKDLGRTLVCCGLFGAAHYGIIALIRMVLYGMEDMNGLMDLLSHNAFGRFRDLQENAAMYAVTVSMAVTAVSGCLFFFGVKAATDGACAMKMLILFFLLPGMGTAFLPLKGCLAALIVSVILFIVCKFVRLPRWKMPIWLYGVVLALFAMLRCFTLFRWTMGV